MMIVQPQTLSYPVAVIALPVAVIVARRLILD